MDVRGQHINLECTGTRTSGAHWEGHAFTMAMIVATHGTQGFSIVLMGKALKHSVVLASVPALTSPHLLCLTGQTKHCNTEKRGMVAEEKTEKNMFEK